MTSQLPLLIPGDVVKHAGSGQVVRVADCQEPIRGLEWIHGPGTVYVMQGWQRIPMARRTLRAVEDAA